MRAVAGTIFSSGFRPICYCSPLFMAFRAPHEERGQLANREAQPFFPRGPSDESLCARYSSAFVPLCTCYLGREEFRRALCVPTSGLVNTAKKTRGSPE